MYETAARNSLTDKPWNAHMPTQEIRQEVNRRMEGLYRRHSSPRDDETVSYYEPGAGYYKPETAEAEQKPLAISLATPDVEVSCARDHDRSFALQSISKVFVHGLTLESHHGRYHILGRVGVEPSDAFWRDNSATALHEQIINQWTLWAGNLQNFVATPAVSPYYNPFSEIGADEFKRMLERRVDFEEIETQPEGSYPTLLVGAVDVLSGEFRTFNSLRDRISADTILASAAIPTLFRSVRLDDGGTYWDGLFSQNPPVRELTDTGPDEIWVIQINPKELDDEPRTVAEIADRRNELAGNLSLHQELGFIEKIDQMLEEGRLSRSRKGQRRRRWCPENTFSLAI